MCVWGSDFPPSLPLVTSFPTGSSPRETSVTRRSVSSFFGPVVVGLEEEKGGRWEDTPRDTRLSSVPCPLLPLNGSAPLLDYLYVGSQSVPRIVNRAFYLVNGFYYVIYSPSLYYNSGDKKFKKTRSWLVSWSVCLLVFRHATPPRPSVWRIPNFQSEWWIDDTLRSVQWSGKTRSQKSTCYTPVIHVDGTS